MLNAHILRKLTPVAILSLAPVLASQAAIEEKDVPAGDLLFPQDLVEGGASTVDFGEDEFTILAWIGPTEKGGPILAKAPPAGIWAPGGKVLYVNEAGNLVYDVGWVGAVRADEKVTGDVGFYVAATHSRDDVIELFVDGKREARGRLEAEPDREDFVVKAGRCSTNFPAPVEFRGSLTEVRLLDRVLTEAEIRLFAVDFLHDDSKCPGIVTRWTVDRGAYQVQRARQAVQAAHEEIDYVDATPDRTDPRLAPVRERVAALERQVERLVPDVLRGDEESLDLLRNPVAALGRIGETLPLRLPSGPPGPGRFGAYYTKLRYSLAWDRAWRVTDHPDVVVRFDRFPDRFVFWRGTSYIPCWVNDRDVWYTNEFLERRGGSNGTEGCCEPMSDKQCRFSHVRIIESHDARVVVHWRYSPVDVEYRHPYVDDLTGWPDWVDEYYTIYPDGVGVRQATIQTSAPHDWTEWQEAIVLNQPGTKPDDNIEIGAVSVANLAGESHTYEWTEEGGPPFDRNPEDACIQVVNLKGERRPFAIVDPTDVSITPYRGHAPGYRFNFWNHWPVAQEKSWTTVAENEAKPSHTSLSHMHWEHHVADGNVRTKLLLHGMTDGEVGGLVPLALSWLRPAPLLVLPSRVEALYDSSQRAYVVEVTEGEPLELVLGLPSSDTPVHNPAFVLLGWGRAGVAVKVDDVEVERSDRFRYGHRSSDGSTDLVVWLELTSEQPVRITFRPLDQP